MSKKESGDKKSLTISVSSIKTFCSSKAKRAGKYLLGIKDDTDYGDSLSIWKLFEYWLMTGNDGFHILEWENVKDMESLMETYDTLKHNAKWLEFKRWESNYEVAGELFWMKYIWYIDNFNEDCIDDIKTAQFLTKKDSKQINHWSWMSYYDEYALQLRLYMKMTWVKKSRILEVSKHKYKEEDRHEHQIIEFELTDEFDKEMTSKYEPIIKEMKEMYEKFDFWK